MPARPGAPPAPLAREVRRLLDGLLLAQLETLWSETVSESCPGAAKLNPCQWWAESAAESDDRLENSPGRAGRVSHDERRLTGIARDDGSLELAPADDDESSSPRLFVDGDSAGVTDTSGGLNGGEMRRAAMATQSLDAKYGCALISAAPWAPSRVAGSRSSS